MNRIKWERSKERYANGFDGVVGKIKCFELNWCSSNNNKNPYILRSTLPGIKPISGEFKEDAGKARAEKIFTEFMGMLNANNM